MTIQLIQSDSEARLSASAPTVNVDEVLAELSKSLRSESESDWDRAGLFLMANQNGKSYGELGAWAEKQGYRAYTKAHIQQIATTAEFFGAEELDDSRPFTHYQEMNRAKRSIVSQWTKSKGWAEDSNEYKAFEASITAAEVLKLTGKTATRPQIFAAIKAKFAPTLPEPKRKKKHPISRIAEMAPTISAPAVGELPLWKVEANAAEELLGKAYDILVAAADEGEARKLVGAPIRQTRRLKWTVTKVERVGNYLTDAPKIMATMPIDKGFIQSDIAQAAKEVAAAIEA